jgi:hypothetical protein
VIVIEGKHISRRALILAAANKDGGAHVDSILPPEYESLKNGFWTDDDTGQLISSHHALCLRQLGFELLNSPELVDLTK